MVERGITKQRRVRRDAEGYERRQREDPSPTALEIERIVAVSEWLGVAPNEAAAALRMAEAEGGADDSLAESIKRVERRLRRVPYRRTEGNRST